MNIRTDRSSGRDDARTRVEAHFVARGRARAGLATAAVTVAVLAGASACVGSSTPASSAGTTTSSSPSSAGTVSLPAASSSASSAASATGAGTASSAGGGASARTAAAACGNSDIAVSLGRAGAAMNHAGQPVIFKNVSGHACSLKGYPGASVMSGGNALVNATRELNGYIGDERQLSSAPLVTLQPGQSASAMLEWEGNAGEKCYSNGSGGLAVTPPNTTKSTSLMAMTVGSNGMCAGFEVHPVVAGIIQG